MHWGFEESEVAPACLWPRGFSGSSHGLREEYRAGTPGDGSSYPGPETLSRSLNPLLQGRFYDSIIKVGKLRFGEREKANYVEVLG